MERVRLLVGGTVELSNSLETIVEGVWLLLGGISMIFGSN